MSETTTLSVPGISCDHCKNSIEGALSSVEGVEQATVSVEARTVDIRFDESKVSLDAVRSTIEDQGYDIER